MHGVGLLQDLAMVMLTAGLVTILFHRFKQPVVLGYILAGILIGPNTEWLPTIHDKHSVDTLAEIGVIFLMFSLGLHFSLKKLASVGLTAVIAAVLEILTMLGLGFGLGKIFGWSNMDSIFLGAILSISSTTIIIKALEELELTKKKFAELIFGILIIEDILAIAMLALLSSIAMTGSLGVNDLTTTLGKLGIFLAVLLVSGLLIVPAALRYVAKFKSNEMLLVAALGMCFGVSLLAVSLGYSPALGAFMIGAIIAEAREAGKIDTLVAPVKDMFSAVFFVAIGMMIDPKILVQYAWPITAITVVVVVGKVLACSAGTFLAGNDLKTSTRVGMGLAQIGEFSFIIAQLGLTLKKPGTDTAVTSAFLYPIAVAVSAITTLLTPYLIKSSDRFVELVDKRGPQKFMDQLRSYTAWVDRISSGPPRASDALKKLLRKWALQLGLNVVLITGIMIGGAWLARRYDGFLNKMPAWTGGMNTLLWVSSVILCLPLIIASLRKLRAAAMVIAEAKITKATMKKEKDIASARALLANLIVIAGSLILAIWVLAISATMLPPWPILLTCVFALIALAATRWNSFVRVYAAAQISIRDTLNTPSGAGHHHDDEPRVIPPVLRDALLETLILPPSSPAAGKLIRELQIRSTTGASVVGIERNNTAIINPGPDEELHPGDSLLILGTEPHLIAARKMLHGEKVSENPARSTLHTAPAN